MTTDRFTNISPYRTVLPEPPEEDYEYTDFLQDLNIELSSTVKKHGFALFGVGRAGTIHLSILTKNPRIDLLYVIDDDSEKLLKIKNYWNLDGVKFLTSNDSTVVYEDSKIEAIVVASPTFTHKHIVQTALEHKKAVFCEKPISETIEEIEFCYDLAEQVNRPLLCAFNRRFDPSYENVRKRVMKGELGQVLTVKACARDSPSPSVEYLKISGGIFHDCAVHDIDLILSLLNEYPDEVSVQAKANIPEVAQLGDYDNVAILLSFPSGAIGIIDINRHCAYGYDQRLEVFGRYGMIRAENQFPLHNVETYLPGHVKKPPIAYSFPSRFAEAYKREMRHFLDVLEHKVQLSITRDDTLAVSKIASLCEEAAKSGKTVEIKWSKKNPV